MGTGGLTLIAIGVMQFNFIYNVLLICIGAFEFIYLVIPCKFCRRESTYKKSVLLINAVELVMVRYPDAVFV